MPQYRSDEASGFRVLPDSLDEVRQTGKWHAGIGDVARAVWKQKLLRVVEVLPRLPDLLVLFVITSEIEWFTPVAPEDLVCQLDVVGYGTRAAG